MNFLIKYKPKKLIDIKGQDKAVIELKSFVENFKKGKAGLLYGPTGTGKSSSVYVLAEELNYEIIEINASDYRNKDNIEKIIGESSQQYSLFKRGKIILVDEIDGLNLKDRGGAQALAKIISKSKWPIFITCNDPFNSKLKNLRSKSKLIEFKKLNYLSVFKILKDICENENVKFREDKLKQLARKSDGDVRAALNDLQNLVKGRELEDIDFGDREHKEDIFNVLRLIFKSKDPDLLKDIFSKTDLDLGECMLWLDENLAKEYKGEDLKNAYNVLSRADVFKGRIRRQQYYRLLIYMDALASFGVGLSKKEKNSGFVSYKRPGRILKLWIAKQKYFKKGAIAEKIAKATHTSTKKVLNDFEYYRNFLKNNSVIGDLKLEEDEIDWLKSKVL